MRPRSRRPFPGRINGGASKHPCHGQAQVGYRPGLPASRQWPDYGGQVETLRQAGADLVTAMTLNSTAEAIGIARAARTAGIPSVISFTLDQDRMVGGTHTLRMAIEEVDAATGSAPAYYMINCSHPVDFGPALDNGAWVRRIRGLRANASSLDHGVLCQLGHLEEGDAVELARQHRDLAQVYPHINVYGGCCGTDYVHVRKICEAVYDVMCRPSDAAEGQGHATSAKGTGRPPPTCDR